MNGRLTAGVGNLCGLDGHQVTDLMDHSTDGRTVFQFANLLALLETEAVEDLALVAAGLRATAVEPYGNFSHP